MNLYSPAKRIGELLTAELSRDPHFYFFSPDETTSNQLGQIFTVERRAWCLPREGWDLPEGENGRIVEMLSENVLFSVMTGHLMNGEPAMMTSYEAFFSIITAQILQQIKFIKQAKEVAWRRPLPAVNLLSTSTCWRQDHNGFTHQSPALISTLLDLPSKLSNCIFPIDDVAAEAAFNYMIKAKDEVNLATFNKNDLPRYFSAEQAREAMEKGVVVDDALNDENPNLVMAAAGDVVAREAIEAIKLLKQDLPEIRTRFVYINTLSYGAIGRHDQPLAQAEFERIFTAERPIVANFHGYPEALEHILSGYAERQRLHVHGFMDEGSTTTPMEMLRRNRASRYDLAAEAAHIFGREDLVQKYHEELERRHAYAVEHGEDML